MIYNNFSKYDIDIDNSTVYSFISERMLSIRKRKDGYIACNITDDKGNVYDKFHQVVYCISNNITKDELPRHKNGRLYDISHINADRGDNRPSNLTIGTHKDNCNNPITRERLRKFGEENPNYGNHLSEENKRKIGEANRYRQAKRVYQIDLTTGEIIHQWPSISEAAKEGGFCAEGIKCCCQGKYSHHHGFLWKYA